MNDKFIRWLYEHEFWGLPGWPLVDDEPLDIENLQVVGSTTAGIEFCCGGDWQNPQQLLLTPELKIEVLEVEINEWPPWDVEVEWPGWLGC